MPVSSKQTLNTTAAENITKNVIIAIYLSIKSQVKT